jgi:hypothetical protein
MSAWYPSFDASVPRSVVEAIRRALDQLYAVRERTDAIQDAGYLTERLASAAYGYAAQQQALQATGEKPLNVTGLVGLLSQPQKAYVPFVDALPDVLHDPMSQDGALVAWNQVIYWFDGRTEPGRWLPLGAVGVLIEDTHANRLTLYPAADYPLCCVFYETDRQWFYHNILVGGVKTWVWLAGNMRAVIGSRPAGLGVNDTGALFYATDWTIWYRFDGTNWIYESGTYRDVVGNRPAFVSPDPSMLGFLFYATDWTILWRWDTNNWVYQEGTYRNTLASIPGGWGAENTNFLFYATDYHHLFRWTGATWEFGPADDGSGFIRMDTQVPNAGLWQICDGSTVARSNPDATTTNVTLPDLTSIPAQAAYAKLGSPYTGVPVAASGGVISGDTGAGTAHQHGGGTLDAAAASAGTPSGSLDNQGSHDHGVGTLNDTAASAGTPAGSLDNQGSHQHVGTTDVGGGAITVANGVYNAAVTNHQHTYTTPAAGTHTHTFSGTALANHSHGLSGSTDTEAAHNHNFTGTALANHDHALSGDTGSENAHTHPAGTLVVSAVEPRNLVVLPYFRR